MTATKTKVLVCATGSVAAIKLRQVVSLLSGSGCLVRVVLTASSKHFVGPEDIPGAEVVYSDADEWAWARKGDPVLHIELRKWADVLLVAPLSANSLAKVAAGIADNCVLCIIRCWDATQKPVLIVN